jgi:hypothetical protein
MIPDLSPAAQADLDIINGAPYGAVDQEALGDLLVTEDEAGLKRLALYVIAAFAPPSLPPMKLYRFADGRLYRLMEKERKNLARIAKIKKIRTKGRLDQLVKEYY